VSLHGSARATGGIDIKEEVMHRKRRLALALLACVLGLALPSSAQAATTSFSGTLLIHQPLKASESFPCAGPGICGEGTLHGLGRVQITIDEDEFEPIEGTHCFATRKVQTVTVLDGSGTIILDSEGTVCLPGDSAEARTSEKSFGHPAFFHFAFTVNGAESTGIYAGATGSGSESFQFAGATGVWLLSGTITTA
jgi:hypothetical protein